VLPRLQPVEESEDEAPAKLVAEAVEAIIGISNRYPLLADSVRTPPGIAKTVLSDDRVVRPRGRTIKQPIQINLVTFNSPYTEACYHFRVGAAENFL
jgi:hypothetical protein